MKLRHISMDAQENLMLSVFSNRCRHTLMLRRKWANHQTLFYSTAYKDFSTKYLPSLYKGMYARK
jgi:hypothetical protein